MVVDPGYLENPFGRIRRFPSTEDRALISSYEREALNWPIQSTVADAMSRSLALLCGYRRCVDTSVLFKMLFSTHDAILFEVPIPHVENFTQNVLPVCMEKALVVPSYGPIYKLGDIDIQLRWGETPPPQTLSDLGIPKHLCGFK
jgi:DNA polymerase I-like protein with 3'-5' exonuclease and polymerase domains